jgi:23S rRNA pseudouridine1911/1915/1917 synthase
MPSSLKSPVSQMNSQTAKTQYTLPAHLSRLRADKALALGFPEHSRVALQRAFDAGLVKVGDTVIKRDHAVHGGDTLTFALPEIKAADMTPADIPLDIIWEDKHLLALNKASGMVVHPGAATGGDTLVHALLAHCAGSLSGVGGVERPGIVHRLDRETSGVMLVAKSDAAHRGLSEQFSARTLQKEYLAIVTGKTELLSGIVDKPIGRNPQQRHKMAVVESAKGGRTARTDWQVVETFDEVATLVRCAIHTGRTHQIRVHMKSLGNIILGDVVYGWKPLRELKHQPDRVMLHAEHLVVTHPITGKTLDLQAPVPADMQSVLKELRTLVPPPKKAAVRKQKSRPNK